MRRSSTFAPLVRLGYIAPNYLICLAEAGFKLNHGMEIICVGCYIVHDIQNVRNDPSGTEYHRNSCKFITGDSPILKENLEILDYSSLVGRLQSFNGFLLPHPLDALDLATNYIYRTGPGLCLVCYFCKVKIRPTHNTNSLEQLVKDIQERRSIGCLCRQRTQSLSSVSVIHLESSDIDGDYLVNPAYGQESDLNQEVHSTHNPARQLDTFIGLGRHQPAYPDFIQIENRIQSFSQLINNANNIPVKELAEKGAFYMGNNVMCCFDCGLQFNLDDDPITKHKEKNFKCNFMQTTYLSTQQQVKK
ncbi:hypothetical protein Btru_033920 [Bulinus truncatus]|nr:hypothetical protein Btru_033920 [Bulinus truncatus]